MKTKDYNTILKKLQEIGMRHLVSKQRKYHKKLELRKLVIEEMNVKELPRFT
jgi:hypothetical protein